MDVFRAGLVRLVGDIPGEVLQSACVSIDGLCVGVDSRLHDALAGKEAYDDRQRESEPTQEFARSGMFLRVRTLRPMKE